MLALRTRLSYGAAAPPADPKRRAALVAPGPRMSHGGRVLASSCPGRRALGEPRRVRGGPHARWPRAAACHSPGPRLDGGAHADVGRDAGWRGAPRAARPAAASAAGL